jgi:hypothetical protein
VAIEYRWIPDHERAFVELALAQRGLAKAFRQLRVGCLDGMDVVAIAIGALVFVLLGALIVGFDRI